MPKFGPLALLKIRGPIPETHERYIDSVNASTASLRKVLATKERYPYVPNLDLDTGEKVRPGGYPLTDETFFKLVARVTKDPTSAVPIGLKQNILEYYADPTSADQYEKSQKGLGSSREPAGGAAGDENQRRGLRGAGGSSRSNPKIMTLRGSYVISDVALVFRESRRTRCGGGLGQGGGQAVAHLMAGVARIE